MTDFPLKVGDTTTEAELRKAFPDAVFIGWPEDEPHVHKIKEEGSDECECGQLLCPDTGNAVGYDTTGEYWHLDGSTCFIHQTSRVPEVSYRTDQEREDYPEDLFDLLLNIAVEADFSPADECDVKPGLEWIADRYLGYRQDPKGFLCFTTADKELNLYLMTPNGVMRAQVTFTYNQEGLDMFAAVVKETP